MQRISCFIATSMALIFASCSSDDAKMNEQPEPPASIEAVKTLLMGANFKAVKAGVHFLSTDTEVEWLEPKADAKMEKEVVDRAKSTELYFLNDTACRVFDNGKSYAATYVLDDVMKDEEKPGIKLRVSYLDEEFKMGEGHVPMVTYTYIIEGINEKGLLLQTPRSFNNKNIIILMSKEESKK